MEKYEKQIEKIKILFIDIVPHSALAFTRAIGTVTNRKIKMHPICDVRVHEKLKFSAYAPRKVINIKKLCILY